MFLIVLVGLGGISAFLFLSLSLVCGLYYLAELVEEYTVATKRVIKYTTYTIAFMHLLLYLFDGFPLYRILVSGLCLGWYSLLLPSFPAIQIASPVFIGTLVLVIGNHFMWFFYFTRHFYSFMEVSSFFVMCVWLVPFQYFISLSANEYTLPSFDAASSRRSSSNPSSPTSGATHHHPIPVEPPKRKRGGNVFKSIIDAIRGGSSDASKKF